MTQQHGNSGEVWPGQGSPEAAFQPTEPQDALIAERTRPEGRIGRDGFTVRLEELSSDIDGIDTDLENLENLHNELAGSVNELQSQVAGLSQEISRLSSMVEKLYSQAEAKVEKTDRPSLIKRLGGVAASPLKAARSKFANSRNSDGGSGDSGSRGPEDKSKKRLNLRTAAVVGVTAVALAVGLSIGGPDKSKEEERAATGSSTGDEIAKEAEKSLKDSEKQGLGIDFPSWTTSSAKAQESQAQGAGSAVDALKSGSVDRLVLRDKSDSTKEAKSVAGKILGGDREYAVSHADGMQNKITSVSAESASKEDIFIANAAGIQSNYGNAQSVYNSLKNRPLTADPGVSHEEMVKYIEEAYTDEGTTIKNTRTQGVYENTGQTSEKNIFTEQVTLNGVRSVTVETADGRKVELKVGGGNDGQKDICVNVIRKVQQIISTQQSVSTKPVSRVTITPAPETTQTVTKVVKQDTIKSEIDRVEKVKKEKEKPAVIPPVNPPVNPPVTPPNPSVTPPAGKDENLSPVTRLPGTNDDDPNVAAPVVTPQPPGAPAEDPYEEPAVVEDPRPAGEQEGTQTPESETTHSGEAPTV